MPILKKSTQLLHMNPPTALTIVHHHDPRGVWATHNRDIMFLAPNASDWQKVAIFPLNLPLDFALGTRLTARVSRADRCSVFPTSTGVLLGIRGCKAYAIDKGQFTELFTINGDTILIGGGAETANGWVYFGEYFMNPKRMPVRIWRLSNDLSQYAVAYTFPVGTIRHVHKVYQDPYDEKRIWVTTGDFKNECYLWYTDDGFQTLHNIGTGTQVWRAVSLLFTEDKLIWLTDTELEQNHIVSMDRRTHKIEFHGEVHSPTWYATQTSDGCYIATTTVEAAPGTTTDQAWVMFSEDAINWEKLKGFPKDRWPLQPFKFGVLSLPGGYYSSEDFWLSGEALVDLDGKSVQC
jgi:hypothetical protein